MTVASNVKQCLSIIKSIENQLAALALNSIETEAQSVFHEAADAIGNVKKDLQYRVLELERLEPQYKGS
jgi:Protein of unknown function (DUF1657)